MTATDQVNGHQVAQATEAPSPQVANGVGRLADAVEVQRLENERQRLRQIEDIRADPVWSTSRTDKEIERDRKVDRRVRSVQRLSRLWIGLLSVRSEHRHARANGKVDREDQRERVSLRKALRKRRRLTDPNSRLTSVYRTYRLVALVLGVLTVIGIAWTSHGIAHTLNGPTPAALYYGVEPLFSGPLIVIVVLQIIASLHGRLTKLRPVYKPAGARFYRLTMVGIVEAVLLGLTVLLNIWPPLTAPVFNFEWFMVRLCPPMLIVVTLVLQLVAAETCGGIIRDSLPEDENDANSTRKRLGRVTRELGRIASMVEAKTIRVQDGEDYPSAAEIQKVIGGEKMISQVIRDLLPEVMGGGEQR